MVIKYKVKDKHRASLQEIIDKINSLNGMTCSISDTHPDGVVIDITFPREDEEHALLIGVLIGTIQSKNIALDTIDPRDKCNWD